MAKFWCDLSPANPYSGQPLKVIWPLIRPNVPGIFVPCATAGTPRIGGQMAAHDPLQVPGVPPVTSVGVHHQARALYEHQPADPGDVLRPEHDLAVRACCDAADAGDAPHKAPASSAPDTTPSATLRQLTPMTAPFRDPLSARGYGPPEAMVHERVAARTAPARNTGRSVLRRAGRSAGTGW